MMSYERDREQEAIKAAQEQECARREGLGDKGRLLEDLRFEVAELASLCRDQHDELVRMCGVVESVRHLLHEQELRMAKLRTAVALQGRPSWVTHGR